MRAHYCTKRSATVLVSCYLQNRSAAQLHAALWNRLWYEAPCKERLSISTGATLPLPLCLWMSASPRTPKSTTIGKQVPGLTTLRQEHSTAPHHVPEPYRGERNHHTSALNPAAGSLRRDGRMLNVPHHPILLLRSTESSRPAGPTPTLHSQPSPSLPPSTCKRPYGRPELCEVRQHHHPHHQAS